MSDIIVIKKDELSALITQAVKEALTEPIAQQKPEKVGGDLITRKETADLLKITLPTLHNYVNNGKLVPRQIGRRTLFVKSEVIASLSILKH